MTSSGERASWIRLSTLSMAMTIAGLLLAGSLVLISNVAVQSALRVGETWTEFSTGPAQKATYLSQLRGAIGYGGVEHDFRSYILRRDRQRLVSIQTKIRDVVIFTEAYRSLGVNAAEDDALQRIERVIGEYHQKVSTAEQMVADGATAREIDDVVVADEEAALAALTILDGEAAAAQNASLATVEASLTQTGRLVRGSAWLLGGLLALFVLSTTWFLRIRLGRPLNHLISVVCDLAMGNVSVAIPDQHRGDEIGELARAVQVFKTDSIALAKRTHLLAEAQQLARIGNWMRDETQEVVEWSDQIFRLFGLEPGEIEVTRTTALEYIHPDDRDEYRVTFARLMEQKEPFTIDVRILWKDGTVCMLRCRGRFIPTGDGTVRVFGTLQDITDQQAVQSRLEASLREKEVLLKEVHHRVKNNLQVISSLLALQANSSREDSVRQGLMKSQRRIMAMASIHETIYGHESLSHLDCHAYVASLIHELSEIHHSEVNIEMDVSGYLHIDQAVPTGLIINELISNALEHAFPAQRAGTISVRLNSAEDSVVLCVQDDGVGIESNAGNGSRPTLGGKLVDALTEQLGGRLNTTVESGTRIEIVFPLLPSAQRALAELGPTVKVS
jgi:PAS domain S-box-containing protein